jgi:protein-S-isoprenylcysteine O-methyltransferase Ste14
MNEHASTGRQVRAALTLPFVVTVVIPGLMLALRLGETQLTGPIRWLAAAVGAVALVVGLTLMWTTIRLLGGPGGGTLAPWDPTAHLVVSGPYRHVRNPMISGVFAVLLGEALLLANSAILIWFVGFVVVNAIYIPLSEEPGLRARFGTEYEAYARHVPRWIPRLTPWEPETRD